MTKLSGLQLFGLIGLAAAGPSISSLESSDNRFSINGGTQITINGADFLPAGYDIGSVTTI